MLNTVLFFSSAILQALLIIIVFYASQGFGGNAKQTRLRRSFYALSVSVIIWSIIQASFDWSNDPQYQEFAIRIGVMWTIIVAVLFVWFAESLTQHKIKKWSRNSYVIVVPIISVLALFSDITSVEVIQGVIITEFNWALYSLYTALTILLFSFGIYILENDAKKNKSKDPLRAKQDLIVSRGMILTALFAFFGNFIFSYFEKASFIGDLLTVMAPSVFIIVTGYTVFTLKLFNFRKFFLRAVIYGFTFGSVYLIIGGSLTYIVSLFVESGSAFFLFTLFLGLVLYPVSQSFTKSFFNFLGRKYNEEASNLQKELDAIFKLLNTTDLLNRASAALAKAYGVDRVIISLNDAVQGNTIASVEYPQENTLSKEQLTNILKVAKHNSERQIITAETIEAAGVSGFTVGFLINRDTFKGLLLIGQRLSGRVIYDDERANLAKISNEIGLALENTLQYTKIQQFNSELQFKIDDATRQLKRSNEKLKALDEAKDDFVSMASHQLRTPLTSVKGYLSMVLEGDAGELNEQQRSMLDQAFTSSQRMTYLIADLLNLSRLKTGKFVIENIPTDLAKVITQELSQVEATAEARKLTITYQEPETFPTLLVDQTKIRQVIMNFVDNAIYYTPSGGEITVKLEELEKSIEFTVRDTGIGVPAADQHNLFSKFYRAANAKQARPDGTGLGLFMARKVIVAQGGATIFRSQVGKGSTFGFSFPKTLVTNEAPKIT